MNPCGCYHGERCTKTTVCAIESAVEDATAMKDEVIEAVKAFIEVSFTPCPIPVGEIVRTRDALRVALNDYEEWEKNL